ncbi:MAG: hypothetical protein O6848_06800, partial [Bacteroidetes bacterium]|nr:hypothetical protein [Bacteroidota bacterium]
DITNFSGISYYPDHRTITSDLIHLSGVEWYSLMHGKGIVMDTMFISEPKIFINKLDSVYIPSDSIILTSSPTFLDSASINHIYIKNGDIDIRNINNLRLKIGQIVTRIDDFKVAKRGERIQWISEFFYAENGPFSVELNQLNHVITGKKITISKSDSTLRLNQFKVKQISEEGALNKIDISVPNIVFTGIDLRFLLDSNLITTRNIHIINPSFDMDFTGSDEFELPGKSEENKNIASNFRFVSDKISLANSNLEIKYIAQNEEKRASASKLDMDIFGIHFDPETPVNKELLFLDRIEINTEDVSHSSTALLDTIYIESLNLNTNKHLKISNLYTLGRNDQVDFNTRIMELKIQSPGWFNKVLNKDFNFDSISVTKPDLDLTILSNGTTEGISLEKISDSINNNPFSIRNINIASGTFKVINDGKNYSAPLFHVNIQDFSSSREMENFFSEDISLTFEGLKNLMPESTGYLDIDKLQISTGENSIRLKGFSYNPKYSKLDYGREIGYQTDWLNIQSQSIDISGIDLWRLIKYQELIVENVLVDSTNIYAYRDKNIPFPIDQVRYMPQKSIATAEFPLTIGSIVVNNMNVTYEELNKGASQAGIIDFKDFTGGILNITNDSSRLAVNHIMTVATNCYILGEGNLQADFEFDLTDPNGKHSYKAFLSEMSLLSLNKMLEPNVNVHISSGTVKELKMEVEGNADYITGEMDFLYNDLHFNLISKKTGTTSAFGPALGSFFANTFIVRSNNPNPLLVRGGDVYAERDTTKAIFNYITKTALSGIVSSIGARNNRKLIKRANKEAQEKQERKKKNNRVENKKVITSKKDD